MHFRGKTGSVVRLFVHLSSFLGAILSGRCFPRLFKLIFRSSTACFVVIVDAIIDLRFVPSGFPSVVKNDILHVFFLLLLCLTWFSSFTYATSINNLPIIVTYFYLNFYL